jgi:prepilin signal peptidase PulO-like enzyme (type II secretory pathway)
LGGPQPEPFLGGLLLALPLFLFSVVSGGRWMGWGDAPLQFSLGVLLGLVPGLTALALAFWVGAAVGLLLILLERLTPTRAGRVGVKGFTIRSEVPFAPFLVLGAWCVHFLHVDFFSALPLLL